MKGRLFSLLLLFTIITISVAKFNSIAETKRSKSKFSEISNITGPYGKLLGKLLEEKQAKPNEILHELKVIQSSMAELEQLLQIKFDDLVYTMNQLSLLNDVKTRQDRYNQYASYIIYQYEKMTKRIDSEHGDVIESVTLHEFAKESTGQGDHHLPNYLRELVELIVPRTNSQGGLPNLYFEYAIKQDAKHEWCDNQLSLHDFMYKSYRYALDVITKGYLVVVESYGIRRAFNEGNFTVEIAFAKDEYYTAAEKITRVFHKLASQASRKLRRCDPPEQIRGKTYLELNKLFQGILVSKLTMSSQHTGKYDCEYYSSGTGYYPYHRIRSDGDWKCHGRMYDCWYTHATDLCHPTTPNRRIDGFLAKNYRDWAYGEKVADHMGNLTNCHAKKTWIYSDWNNPNYFGIYDLGPCGCICDDYEHPDTLRKFSKEIATSDYGNNMVVTGIKFVNIDNVIHIDIQQGELGSFGYVNQSTVQWRPQSEISAEVINKSKKQPITLSYHQRTISLDIMRAEPNHAIIGVGFDVDHNGHVVLSVLTAEFAFATGDMNTANLKWISRNTNKTEFKLDKPHMPTMCGKNVPVDASAIQVQTTDWLKDAAQTTIPYLDIQEVVTNPPSLLGGVGLRYKNSQGCGGYVGFELYSYDYTNVIGSESATKLEQ